MKSIPTRLYLFLALMVPIMLTSCQDKIVQTYQANVPQYQSLEDWRQTTFELSEARTLDRPGKIYVYHQYLLVNELYEGVHIFDNSNPANPVQLGFLQVLANVDMAVKDNVLYLDSYRDLLAFDISDIGNPSYLGRAEDVFSFRDYGYLAGYDQNYPMVYVDETKGVVVGWAIEEITEETQTGYHGDWLYTMDFSAANVSNESASLGGIGQAGSTARFAIYQNALYTLETFELGTFDISNRVPVHQGDIGINRVGETLFPAQEHLFIGTNTGMMIFNLANPLAPVHRSDYNHVMACDPVVVDGNRAYVTLASGRFCGGNSDVLDVIDISNLDQPSLIRSYPMTNPKGMGLANELLFLCDGPDGLKVFDRSDDNAIDQNQLAHFPNITTNDVIPVGNVLIMTAEEGIYQYDFSNVNNITQLSLISVQ